MQSPTTTLAAVAHDEPGALRHLSSIAMNVSVLIADDHRDTSRSAMWRQARSRPSVFSLVDFDPLEVFVQRWLEMLDTGDPLVVELTPTVVPDYYLVATDLAEPVAAWYFQLLFDLAPTRVIATGSGSHDLYEAIAGLAYGPSLPTHRELEDAARSFVPTPGFRAALAPDL